MLALALLAPAARAGDGEAHHNLRGAAVHGTLARNVYRRCHLVLRLVLAERLRVRRSKIKTVQGEEHGRRPHRARGLPRDVRHL